MKDPYTGYGAGAIRVTSTATFARSEDATNGLSQAIPNEQRFRWCPRSNSVQPLKIRKGSIEHE